VLALRKKQVEIEKARLALEQSERESGQRLREKHKRFQVSKQSLVASQHNPNSYIFCFCFVLDTCYPKILSL